MFSQMLKVAGVFTILALTATSTAKASDFTFNGTFLKDDDVAIFQFTTQGASSPITLSTSSYAAGGFDPILSLFDGSGNLLDVNDDGPSGRDSLLTATLSAGNYWLSLTQFENLPVGPNLSNGFLFQGMSNFTSSQYGNGAPGYFFNIDGNQRNGNWNVTLQGAVSAFAVPEPGAVAFALCGLVSLVGIARRKKG